MKEMTKSQDSFFSSQTRGKEYSKSKKIIKKTKLKRSPSKFCKDFTHSSHIPNKFENHFFLGKKKKYSILKDLKPENLLIDKNGHIRLTDFGISKFIATQKANSFCGSLEYIAPEVWQHDSYGIEVDFWCLGTVIYEMKYKMPPFYSTNLREMQNKILNGNPKFDENCSVELHDLIQKLLTKDPKQRLGTKSIREIMEHTFFSDLDWEKVEKQEIIPEFIPQVKDSSDTSCIDSQFLNQPIFEFHILPDIVKMDQNMFSGFSFSKFK